MEKGLALLLFVVGLTVAVVTYPLGPAAVLFNSILMVLVFVIINKSFAGEEKVFLQNIFVAGLILRMILAAVTYVFSLQEFFGGDSLTYDFSGWALYNSWFGVNLVGHEENLKFATREIGSGWGMSYLVATIYTVIGRNPFAIQLFNSILGAATACLIYVCAKQIFHNSRVARISSILVAVFPSLVLWSSQGLKDGIICFLLALAIYTVLSLQKKFDYVNILILLFALVGIYSLRFYIFFAFIVAIFGSFFLAGQKSGLSIVRQVVVLVVITLGLTYMGVLRNAQSNVEFYGSLETLQASRLDQARSAQSGFGQDIDVSTPTGAIQALPLGVTYLLLAPFPWQMANFRQAITLPESLVWWSSIPFLFTGIWFTLKNKLRESIGIILLTLLLTISYGIFQGNVGTAYRMRAQMQIFYFIFVAVGYTLWKERRENQNLERKNRKNNRFP